MGTRKAHKKLSLTFAFTLVVSSAWVLASTAPTAAEVPGPGDTEQHPNIWIEGDDQFNPSNGVRRGRGTKRSPFVISGWDVSSVYIKDTSAHLVVKDNDIDRLHLNWNGGHVKVVDNAIGDLRVNENIERTGDPTSGLIARNQFDVVGQLRHWDGVFEDNTVGSQADITLPFFADQAVNFDGFNGARFRDNTIYGFMDARLHGHHHSSSFKGKSHYHGAAEERGHHNHHGHHGRTKKVNHSRRFHRVVVSNNRIYSSGPWALRYVDDNHAANDRTAASESNEALNRPHVHYTRVTFKRNKVFGRGLYVDIFNAEDELHKRIGRGSVRRVGNKIKLARDTAELFSSQDGITVYHARGLMLHIARNRIGWMNNVDVLDEQFAAQSGIRLYELDHARVHVYNNRLSHFEFGVYASQFSDSVHWWVKKLRTSDVHRRIYYDNTVANHPHRGRQ